MVVSALLVLSLICLRNTWEKKKDTCSLVVLFFLSILLGSINYFADGIRPQSLSEKAFHFFWIISHYLQVPRLSKILSDSLPLSLRLRRSRGSVPVPSLERVRVPVALFVKVLG